jgi:LysM repeat protein
MVARSRARYLAPIALIATIAGTYVVVHSALKHKGRSATSQTITSTTTPTNNRRLRRARYYTVKSGDSLTSIAAKTGVSLATLKALNHSVQPEALQTGQRIRLRR